MNMNAMRWIVALGVALAAIASAAFAGVQGASEAAKPAAPGIVPALTSSEPATPADATNDVDKKKKTVPKPVAPEPLTPEQATHRAADPKAPSGALIVKPPEDLPVPAAGGTPPAPPPAK